MTPDLQKYYESRFDTMATDGWKDLMEDEGSKVSNMPMARIWESK